MTVSQSLISYVLAAGLLTLTPGLDTALVLRVAATEGPWQAWRAGLGVATGTLVWGAIVAIGLGALMATSALAFTVLKWTGVAYLLWLGLQMICRPSSRLPVDSGLAPTWAGRRDRYWNGLLQNLLNPKVGIFYVSFLPQFIPETVAPVPYTLLLAAIHAGLGSAWFLTLIVASRPIVRWMRRPSALETMDRITGAVFIGFGVKLALSRR